MSLEAKTGINNLVMEIVGGVRCYEKDGVAYLNIEDVAKGLGFTQEKNNVIYVKWERVNEYLRDLNFSPEVGKNDFIPENIFYRLAMKAKNETAERFQAKVADEIIPTVRRTGGYVSNDELFIKTYLPYADESTKLIFAQTLKTVREQNETIKQQKEEIAHKEDVIIGLVEDIDLATKRQRITQIVRYGATGNYQERYNLLYSEFERKYHCDLKRRMEKFNNVERFEHDPVEPKAKNKMDYIDRGMKMIPQLYEIACKLFENDVEKLKAEWDSIIS